MLDYKYKCPLCGHGFDKSDEKCHACPMAKECNVVCCPNCGYSFTGESNLTEWLKKKFGGPKTGERHKKSPRKGEKP